MTRPSLAPALVLLPALAACAGHVEGSIGGEEIPPLDGFFYQEPGAGMGGTSAVHVHLWSEPDACDRVAAYIRATAEVSDWSSMSDDDLAMLADAADEHLPDDYWEMLVSFFVPDLEARLGGTSYDGLETLATGSPELLAHATHHVQGYDEAFYDGTGARSDYFTSWVNRGGSLDIRGHRPGKKVSGSLTTSWIRNGSADEDGETTLSFSVKRCIAVENAYALFEQ